MKKILLATSIAMAASLAMGAVIQPTTGYATSTFGTELPAQNLVNGSGLDTTDPDVMNWTHSNVANGEMWHVGPQPDLNLLPGGATGYPPLVTDTAVAFALPSEVTLNGAYIWQMNQETHGGGRGVASFELLVSADVDPATASWTSVGSFGGLVAGSLLPGETAQYVDFGSIANVSSVRFNMLTATSGATSEFIGLSEVRFEAIPEPATFGLFAAMGGAILFIRRRNMI